MSNLDRWHNLCWSAPQWIVQLYLLRILKVQRVFWRKNPISLCCSAESTWRLEQLGLHFIIQNLTVNILINCRGLASFSLIFKMRLGLGGGSYTSAAYTAAHFYFKLCISRSSRVAERFIFWCVCQLASFPLRLEGKGVIKGRGNYSLFTFITFLTGVGENSTLSVICLVICWVTSFKESFRW